MIESGISQEIMEMTLEASPQIQLHTAPTKYRELTRKKEHKKQMFSLYTIWYHPTPLYPDEFPPAPHTLIPHNHVSLHEPSFCPLLL